MKGLTRLFSAVALFALSSLPAGAQSSTNDPTAALLVDLIRVNTSNPPGNERQRRRSPRAALSRARVRRQNHPDAGFGEGDIIARLKGDGSKRPVLIAAHADVVGVEREKWSVDPFAGDDQRRLRLRPRRDRFQGRHGGVRARGDDARRAKGAARARRDLPRRSGRRERRPVQHGVAGARATGPTSTPSSR